MCANYVAKIVIRVEETKINKIENSILNEVPGSREKQQIVLGPKTGTSLLGYWNKRRPSIY